MFNSCIHKKFIFLAPMVH